uniref:Uncharacterized protein n=1 Tax=Lactuca sativa TaxID=4236 RepID=A0A9R1UMZ2_LACSA|nr:hypothetical protein LSAT_V11C800437380 [Lactuca sativa]
MKRGCPRSARIPMSLLCLEIWAIFMYLELCLNWLVGRSIVHPKGVLEDVLVQVNELVFPADSYVLDMGDVDSPNSSSIFLGRSFLKTTNTKINVYNGTLSMEFVGELVLNKKFDKNSVKKIADKFKLDDGLLGIMEFMDDKKKSCSMKWEGKVSRVGGIPK